MQNEVYKNSNTFCTWFREGGGKIHDDLSFFANASGLLLRTRQALSSETIVASCPLSLAITTKTTEEPLQSFCGLSLGRQSKLSQRQRICAYIGLHYLISDAEDEKRLLRHRPYIQLLPKREQLRTPLYFSDAELGIFRGTNLYGAVSGQCSIWMNEHQILREVIAEHSPTLADRFTYDIYQMAATYLSSRAFPSTLLSGTPSLIATPEAYPVLLPGVDLFNHKRGHPVTWGISRIDSTSDSQETELCISLSANTSIAEGEEVFNNYGPKPNSSLILGYGFAIPENPDDTILLKIGSSGPVGRMGEAQGHEIGREARGTDALWSDLRKIIASRYDEDLEHDDDEEDDAARELRLDMETSESLSGMVSVLTARLPELSAEHDRQAVREEVREMWSCYVRGQRDILNALLRWIEWKDREILSRADELGIQIIDEEETE